MYCPFKQEKTLNDIYLLAKLLVQQIKNAILLQKVRFLHGRELTRG